MRFYQNQSPAPTFGMKLAVICICLDQGLYCKVSTIKPKHVALCCYLQCACTHELFLQLCDEAISQGYTGFVDKLQGRTIESNRIFEGESVTIQVGEGWKATFDKKNPKVRDYYINAIIAV